MDMTSYLQGFMILKRLKEIQRWKLEKIQDFQLSKLKRVITYAYENTKFYHDYFKNHDIKPYDINTLKDINKLPILKKDDVRSSIKDMISHQNLQKLRKLRTSGSSGSPLFIYINSEENLMRKAAHLRANSNLGQKIRDRWVTITAPHHFGEITWLQNIFNIYCPRPISVFTDIREQVNQIERFNPDILDGYATSLYLLAEEVNKIDRHDIKPKYMVSSAEMLTQSHRKYIERVFEVPLYDQYSCVEFGRVSWECKERLGYHIDSDNFILQFVDSEGNEVGPGEVGQIICTSLFNFTMPLIRYSIGDLGSPSDDHCDCGINLPLMNSIEGRKDSLIQLPNGKEMSPRAFSIAMGMFKYYDKLHQFQIIQKKLDFFKIFVCLEDKTFNHDVFLSELESHMIDIFKEKIIFDIEVVDYIPPHKSGKYKYVISELDNNIV